MSPAQLSLQALRERGYIVEMVEHYNSFTHRRKDLWGFIDILAIKENSVLAVQVAGGIGEKNPHLEKMNESELLPIVKSAGIKIELHIWRKLITSRYKNGNPKRTWVNDITTL